jgi:RNA polymerase sigma factor (sigma-70 family)
MAASITDWLRNLRDRLPGRPDTASDADLLTRYASTRDDESFAGLVARHGPMVFGVCRRVCGPGPDAEDAFQAAFVVLAVKAAVVARSGRVGAWLHGIAFNVARKARERSHSRSPAPADVLDQLPARELPTDPDATRNRELIDGVLAGLPEKYRACVVLCDLEGLSRKDAAAQLGWTEGTLSGRLARARGLLADRLSRRGVTLGAGGVAAVLSALAAPAVVAGELAASAIRVAALVGEGTSLPAGLAALTHGVTRSMFPTHLKVAAALTGAGLLVVLGSLLAETSTPAPPELARLRVAAESPPIPVAPVAADPEWVERHTCKHTAPITAIAFGPDMIAAADTDGGIILWDAQSGKEKERIIDPEKRKQKDTITWLGFSPDATWLNVVMMDGHGVAARRMDGKNRQFGGFGDPNTSSRFFGFSPDGKYYLHSGLGNKGVAVMPNRLTENVAGGLVNAHLAHNAEVLLVVVSDDSTVAVTATADGAVHLWVIALEGEQWRSTFSNFTPTALAVGPGGKTAAVAGQDGKLFLMDDKGDAKHKLDSHEGAVNSLAFSPDGKLLASAGADRLIRLWDVATGKEVATLKGHNDSVKAVAFSPDGKMLASGSADKTVRVWASSVQQCKVTLRGKDLDMTAKDRDELSAAVVGMLTKSNTTDYFERREDGITAEVWKEGTETPKATGLWVRFDPARKVELRLNPHLTNGATTTVAVAEVIVNVRDDGPAAYWLRDAAGKRYFANQLDGTDALIKWVADRR